MSTLSAGVKLIIFAVVSVLAAGLVSIAITGSSAEGETVRYRAIFNTASGLIPGSDVRLAGVVVGKVTEVRVVNRDQAEVTFTVQKGWPLTTSTRAIVRYENLVGDRYLEIAEGNRPGEPLEPGGVIPITQTQPALDLTVLFNGFRPLFQALSPAQVNRLAGNIVAVLQGESGTVESLLAQTASLTNTLADREAVIDDLIENLTAVLATLDERDRRFSRLIGQLQEFVSGLAADRNAIGESLERLRTLTDVTADLLEKARPPLRADIAELRRLAGVLAAQQGELAETLNRLPGKLHETNATASYGSWFNLYLCRFDVKNLPVPPGKSPTVVNQSPRCTP